MLWAFAFATITGNVLPGFFLRSAGGSCRLSDDCCLLHHPSSNRALVAAAAAAAFAFGLLTVFQ